MHISESSINEVNWEAFSSIIVKSNSNIGSDSHDDWENDQLIEMQIEHLQKDLETLPFLNNVYNNNFFDGDSSTVYDNHDGWEKDQSKKIQIEGHIQTVSQVNGLQAFSITNTIFQEKHKLTANGVSFLAATENQPLDMLVTENFVSCFTSKVGEGTYSDVYKSEVIAFHPIQYGNVIFSPSKTKTQVFKASKMNEFTFSPEKRKLDQIIYSDKKGIDYPLATFKAQNGQGFTMNEFYSVPLDQVRFADYDVSVIFVVISPIIDRLIETHHSGYLHRDIKGNNLLVSKNGNSWSSAITDFGFLAKKSTSLHDTESTPLYIDPMMFGKVENSLVNQKKEGGSPR